MAVCGTCYILSQSFDTPSSKISNMDYSNPPRLFKECCRTTPPLQLGKSGSCIGPSALEAQSSFFPAVPHPKGQGIRGDKKTY